MTTDPVRTLGRKRREFQSGPVTSRKKGRKRFWRNVPGTGWGGRSIEEGFMRDWVWPIRGGEQAKWLPRTFGPTFTSQGTIDESSLRQLARAVRREGEKQGCTRQSAG